MANFDKAVETVLDLEGGFVNNPLDPGGATRYGITEAVARAHGYKGEMKELPRDFAVHIYKRSYWDFANLDACQSQTIAENIFDCAVNCGVANSVRFLQRGLNVLNNRGTLWPDISVDGRFGDKTLEVLNIALKKKYMEKALVKIFNVLRGNYYIEICERRAANEVFMLGWVLHRLHLGVIPVGSE